MTDRPPRTVWDMARSSQPHTSSQHHIYDSVPELSRWEQELGFDGADTECSAILVSGVGAGDVVLVSTFSPPRVAQAIRRCGAEPIFIDVSLETWHVSPEVFDMAARWCLSIGSTPTALVAVDVYGMRGDIDALRDVCGKYDMALIGDRPACEGSGQQERLPAVVARRREIHARYRRGFAGVSGIRFMPPSGETECNPWSSCVVFEEFDLRDRVMVGLADGALGCSSLWQPLHTLPTCVDSTAIVDGTAEHLFEHGLRLPSSSTLTDSQVDEVIERVVTVLG